MWPHNKPPLDQGVRLRYAKWLLGDKKAYLKMRAFGVVERRAKSIATGKRQPSLREALIIDCVTNGECGVYSWISTEQMEMKSHELVKQGVDSMFNLRTRAVPIERREQLRMSMVQRLGDPGYNALAITAKLGKFAINRDARRNAVLRILQAPISVDEDADDEEVQRAIEGYERRRARAVAYVKGQRSSPDQ